MQKTITFTDTSELQWAATAYIRRTSLIVRLVVLAVAAVAAAVYFQFGDRLGTISKLLLRFFLAYVTFVFLSIIWAKLKAPKREDTDVQCRVTFSDDGFVCKTEEPESTASETASSEIIADETQGHETSVAWNKVYWVRQEDDFWALHYTIDGREAFTAIPKNVIDDELSELILANTPPNT